MQIQDYVSNIPFVLTDETQKETRIYSSCHREIPILQPLGRAGAVILMFFGLGIIGVLSSYLSTTFISLGRREGKENDEENEQDEDDSTSRDAELAAIREELAALRKLFEEHSQPQ